MWSQKLAQSEEKNARVACEACCWLTTEWPGRCFQDYCLERVSSHLSEVKGKVGLL